jgi:hypothetical protein
MSPISPSRRLTAARKWSQSGHSGHRSKRPDQVRFMRTRLSSKDSDFGILAIWAGLNKIGRSKGRFQNRDRSADSGYTRSSKPIRMLLGKGIEGARAASRQDFDPACDRPSAFLSIGLEEAQHGARC